MFMIKAFFHCRSFDRIPEVTQGFARKLIGRLLSNVNMVTGRLDKTLMIYFGCGSKADFCQKTLLTGGGKAGG